MQLSFLPSVLARVAPELSLERHMAEGLRPSLRAFEEFKPLQTTLGVLNTTSGVPVVGSAVVKSGTTTVFCGISVGTVERDAAQKSKYASVFPVVEVSRGRSGAPTDEEMILSESIHEAVLHSRILPREALKVVPGVAISHENSSLKGGSASEVLVYYPDIHPDEYALLDHHHIPNHEVVLAAHVKVLSRDGPLFDICHRAVVAALHNVRLPRMYINDAVDIRVPVRSRGNFGHLASSQQLNIDANSEILAPLQLNAENAGLASSFGVVDAVNDGEKTEKKQVLLAQLEGDAEEAAVASRISIIATKDRIQGFSLTGPIDRDQMKRAIQLAQVRAEVVGGES